MYVALLIPVPHEELLIIITTFRLVEEITNFVLGETLLNSVRCVVIWWRIRVTSRSFLSPCHQAIVHQQRVTVKEGNILSE